MQQAIETGQPYQTRLDPLFVFEKRVAFEVIVSGQLWLCDDLGHNHLRLKLGKGFRYYTEPNLPCRHEFLAKARNRSKSHQHPA